MRPSSRFAAHLGGVAAGWGPALVRALGGTWDVRVAGRDAVDAARRGRGAVLYILMHGGLLPLVYVHRARGIQVLVSQSRDGEIMTRVIERLGFGTVRGSSTKRGERAVVEMAARGRAGFDLGVTPDGPRGPRGVASPGAALIAARADLPVVPLGVGASAAWRARSWDRFLVPKPFARVWVVYGEPLRFTREDLSDPERAAGRLSIAMRDAEETAQAFADGTRPAPAGHRVPA